VLKQVEQVLTLEETSEKISLVLAILSCRTVEIKGFSTEAAVIASELEGS
jgi:hypothetical protein